MILNLLKLTQRGQQQRQLMLRATSNGDFGSNISIAIGNVIVNTKQIDHPRTISTSSSPLTSTFILSRCHNYNNVLNTHCSRFYNSKSNPNIYYQDIDDNNDNGKGEEKRTEKNNAKNIISKSEEERIKAELYSHRGTDEYHITMMKAVQNETSIMDDMINSLDNNDNGQVKNAIDQMQKVTTLYWDLGMLDDAQSLQENILKHQIDLYRNPPHTETDTGTDNANLPQHMNIAKTMHTIGSIQSRLNQADEAKKWFQASLKMKEQLLVHNNKSGGYLYHYQIGKTFNGLALVEIQKMQDEDQGYDCGGDGSSGLLHIVDLFQTAEYHYIFHGEKKKTGENNGITGEEPDDDDDDDDYDGFTGDSLSDHPHVGSINENLAILYRQHGDFELAIQKYKEALRIQMLWTTSEELEKNSDTNVVNLTMDMGDCFKALEKYDRALEKFEEALRLHLKVIRKERQRQYQEKQLSESSSSPSSSTEILNPMDDIVQSPMEAILRHNIGHMHAQMDRYQLASEEYQSSLRIKKKIDATHPEVALTLNGIGALKAAQSEYKSALAHFEEALYIYKLHSTSIFGLGEDEDENIAQTKKNIALVQRQMDRGGFGSRSRGTQV